VAKKVKSRGIIFFISSDSALHQLGAARRGRFLLRGAMHFEQDDSTSYVRLDERKSWLCSMTQGLVKIT
jgi:hypothetical protein